MYRCSADRSFNAEDPILSHTKNRASHYPQLHHTALPLQWQWVLSLCRLPSPALLEPVILLVPTSPYKHHLEDQHPGPHGQPGTQPTVAGYPVKCHPLADKSIMTWFCQQENPLVGINSVKWLHLLCFTTVLPGDPRKHKWCARIRSNSINLCIYAFTQYPWSSSHYKRTWPARLTPTHAICLLQDCPVQQRGLRRELVEGKQGYEVLAWGNPQNLQKEQLGT